VIPPIAPGEQIEVRVNRPFGQRWETVPVVYADTDFLAVKLDGETHGIYRRGPIAWRRLQPRGDRQ
jgi:hypothetical protein